MKLINNKNMLKKGFSTILIVVIVLVVITGGVLTWRYWSKLATEQEPPIVKDSLIIDETADWQVYRDMEYGFEIKHPEKYNVGISLTPAQMQIGKITIYITSRFGLFRAGRGRYSHYEILSESFPQGIFLEDILINKVPFKKDYYIEYREEGSWDTSGARQRRREIGSWGSGINAFTRDKHNENYYVISLNLDGLEAMPPEAMLNTDNGVCGDDCFTKEAKDWLGVKMKEGVKSETKIFHQMLSTFRFLD